MTEPLPRPENWRQRPIKMALLTVFAIVMGGTFLVMAYTDGIRRHHLAEAVALIGWGTIALIGAAMAVLMAAGLTRPRIDAEDAAVVLRPALALEVIVRALLIVMAVAGIVGIGAWWHGELHVDGSHFEHRQEMRWIYASAAMAFIGVWTCPRWFGPRCFVGDLRLDARGLEYRQGRRTIEIAWEDVAAITDTGRGKDQRRPITFTRTDGSTVTYLPTPFGQDAALVYWAIQYYWQHPERRTEFETTDAVRRLTAGDVSPVAALR